MGPSFKFMFTQFSLFFQFCRFLDFGCSAFISVEKRGDCGVLGTSLHPGNERSGCC